MSVTVEVTLYSVDELDEDAFDKAHKKFAQDLWEDYWPVEVITDTLWMVAAQHGPDDYPVFGKRFLGWDTYPKRVCYEDGKLNRDEVIRLAKVCPSLEPWEGEADLELVGDQIIQNRDYWDVIPEESWPKVKAEIDAYMDMLTGELLKALDAEERWLESADYFRDMAEGNEWLFHQDGRISWGLY